MVINGLFLLVCISKMGLFLKIFKNGAFCKGQYWYIFNEYAYYLMLM